MNPVTYSAQQTDQWHTCISEIGTVRHSSHLAQYQCEFIV